MQYMTINISYQQTLSYFKSSSTKGGQHPVLHIIWESCGHNAPIIKNANIMLFPLIQNLSGVKKKVTSCGKRAEGNLPFAPQDSTSTILKTDDSSVKKKMFPEKRQGNWIPVQFPNRLHMLLHSNQNF